MFILGDDSNDDEKDNLNPEDFMIKNKEGEVIVRKPGEVQGQSFTIDNLKDCTVALFDNSAQVQIDDCIGCKFFIGPCEGSVFVRNSMDCNIIVSCNQFRTRECTKCNVLLHCAQGQPIIEKSSEICFGPFEGGYVELRAQLEAADMNAWNTEWMNVHDFTPPKGSDGPHWRFIAYDVTTEKLLERSLTSLCDSITPELSPLIPRSWGLRDFNADTSDQCFVILGGSNPEKLGYSLIESKNELKLARARVREVSDLNC